jgi:glycosyltransferase involved in cell wall biosynthesis
MPSIVSRRVHLTAAAEVVLDASDALLTVPGGSHPRASHARARPVILFVINSLTGGGAERVMTTILSYSERESAEFDIRLALLDDEPAAYRTPTWLPVYQFDCRGSLLRSIRAMRELVARERPDLTLSFLTRANFTTVLASLAYGQASLISERAATSGHHGSGARRWLANTAVRLIYPRATGIVAVSSGIARDLRENYSVPEDKLNVIANPVNVAAIRALSAEEPTLAIDEPFIMSMGRFVRSKNFALLIKAFAASSVPGKLVIAGQGPERQSLLDLAAKHGLAGRLLFPGFLRNPFPLLRRARAFVLPSNGEGFPNSVVEAMALGVPVISTNCACGPSEVLAGMDREQVAGLCFAEHGILVPPDDVEAMAGALEVLQDDTLRERYRTKGPSRAEEYSVEAAKDRYWDAIRAALAKTALAAA